MKLSVLSVEPYGMKHVIDIGRTRAIVSFSALGRAVWDETQQSSAVGDQISAFSALGRAVWDETIFWRTPPYAFPTFSALGRAVWDETALNTG